jgi:hypothetical protein
MMHAPADPAPVPEQAVRVAPIARTPIGEGEPAAAPTEELDPIEECDCADLLCGEPMERCGRLWLAWADDAREGWSFEPFNVDPPSRLSASDVWFEAPLDLVEIVLSRQANPWSKLFTVPALEVLDAPDRVAVVDVRPMP